MEIRLIVIRTPNPQALSEFYALLGLQFVYHKHGNSPYHYSASIGTFILEIYPLSRDQPVADKHLRIGFTLDNFDAIIEILKQKKVHFVSDAKQTDFGLLAIIQDPDKRRIELYKK